MALASNPGSPADSHRGASRWNQRTLAPWLFLAPGLFMFTVYVLWPVFESITLSFYDWNGLYNQDGAFTGRFVGLANYRELLIDPAFDTSLWNNLKWLVLYMLALPLGLFMAIFLNQTVTGIRLYKSLFFFPFVISQVVVGLIFAWFYAPNFGLLYILTEWVRSSPTRSTIVAVAVLCVLIGLILAAVAAVVLFVRWLARAGAGQRRAAVLGAIGLALVLWLIGPVGGSVSAALSALSQNPTLLVTWPAELWSWIHAGVQGRGRGIAILADPNLVTYGIIAAGLWPQIAYVMILYLTGLNNVAPDQIEAARLDGAKGWRMLWYVVLPQLRPATFIAIIVTVIGALRSFDLVSIMTSGGPFGSSRVLSYYMFEMALGEFGFRMGYGAAIAVVLFAIMMIFILGFIWKMWRDEKER
jgi:ABC-type sugar transport system permease subunit